MWEAADAVLKRGRLFVVSFATTVGHIGEVMIAHAVYLALKGRRRGAVQTGGEAVLSRVAFAEIPSVEHRAGDD